MKLFKPMNRSVGTYVLTDDVIKAVSIIERLI